MTIAFSCPWCFHHYRLKDRAAGRSMNCRQCGRAIAVTGAVGPFTREPRPIAVSPSTLRQLCRLRSLASFGGTFKEKRSLPPAVLAVEALRDVERELGCLFPEDLLAAFANRDGYLCEHGFRIERVVEHTRQAHRQGCPRDLVAVGEDDGHVYYCLARYGELDKAPSLMLYDNDDGSTAVHYLPDWLTELVEARRAFVAEADAIHGWSEPTVEELAAFCPQLVAGFVVE